MTRRAVWFTAGFIAGVLFYGLVDFLNWYWRP